MSQFTQLYRRWRSSGKRVRPVADADLISLEGYPIAVLLDRYDCFSNQISPPDVHWRINLRAYAVQTLTPAEWKSRRLELLKWWRLHAHR